MTGAPIDMWATLVAALHIAGAAALLGIGGWLLSRREKLGPAAQPILAALGITAFWGLAFAALGAADIGTQLFLGLSYLAWFWALYRLFAHDGRHETVRPIRTVIWALAFVEMLQFGLIAIAVRFGSVPGAATMIFDLSTSFRLLCTVGALVLVHNLYVGASPAGRLSLRWPAAALAAMWLYDLNFYTVAYLTGAVPQTLADMRGVVMILMAVLIAIGSALADGELTLSLPPVSWTAVSLA